MSVQDLILRLQFWLLTRGEPVDRLYGVRFVGPEPDRRSLRAALSLLEDYEPAALKRVKDNLNWVLSVDFAASRLKMRGVVWLNFQDAPAPYQVAFFLLLWSTMVVVLERSASEVSLMARSIGSARRFLEWHFRRPGDRREELAQARLWMKGLVEGAEQGTETDRRLRILRELRALLLPPRS